MADEVGQPDVTEQKRTRRDFIKKAGAGTALVWTAPVADAVFAAPAAAHTSSGAECMCHHVYATHVGWAGTAGPTFRVEIHTPGCDDNLTFQIQFTDGPLGNGFAFQSLVPFHLSVSSAYSPTLAGGAGTSQTVNATIGVIAHGNVIPCGSIPFTLDPTI